MITPSEIQELGDALFQIYADIEDDLIRSVAKRFKLKAGDQNGVTGALDWQIEKMQQLGALRRENLAIIAKHSGRTVQEVERLIREAGYRSIALDEKIYQSAFASGTLPYAPAMAQASPMIQQILKGAIDNAAYSLNLVNTTAVQSAEAGFIRIINQSYLESSLGILDYNAATRKAVQKFAESGITGAEYVSAAGKLTRNHIDVAVRRAILTSSTQAAGKVQIQRAREWGANLVEVTSHLDARPSHAEWQGKIYSIDGGTAEYPNLAAVTGYGTAAGLKGMNCRHDFYPFFPGISEQTYKPYPLEETEKAYKESQQQRTMERGIREQKRKIIAADEMGDAGAKKAAQLKLKSKEAALKQFIADTGRTQRTARQQVYGFGRSEAMQAVWAKRKG